MWKIKYNENRGVYILYTIWTYYMTAQIQWAGAEAFHTVERSCGQQLQESLNSKIQLDSDVPSLNTINFTFLTLDLNTKCCVLYTRAKTHNCMNTHTNDDLICV